MDVLPTGNFFGGRLFATSCWLTESKKLRRSASIMRRSCARADSLRGSGRVSSTRRFNLLGWIGSSNVRVSIYQHESLEHAHRQSRHDILRSGLNPEPAVP